MVPESSERCTTVMFASGSFASVFRPAIFESFHLVILPEKMPAMVVGVEVEVA